jgi:adenosylcobinamide amidohydrolase
MKSSATSRRQLGQFHGIKAEVVGHSVYGEPANALLICLPEAKNSLSGRQGFKKVEAVCNCYLPQGLWALLHEKPASRTGYFKEVLRCVLGDSAAKTKVDILSTGVTMDELAWVEESYQELWVLAFVTAGVKSNALRLGVDKAGNIERKGQFEPVGTINTIVITSASLSQAAMAGAFITITEGKVIALEDLGVKSAYSPELQASGTGTDQIVVISGDGDRATYVGGHSKLGELMARAVTRATKSALKKRQEGTDKAH